MLATVLPITPHECIESTNVAAGAIVLYLSSCKFSRLSDRGSVILRPFGTDTCWIGGISLGYQRIHRHEAPEVLAQLLQTVGPASDTLYLYRIRVTHPIPRHMNIGTGFFAAAVKVKYIDFVIRFSDMTEDERRRSFNDCVSAYNTPKAVRAREAAAESINQRWNAAGLAPLPPLVTPQLWLPTQFQRVQAVHAVAPPPPPAPAPVPVAIRAPVAPVRIQVVINPVAVAPAAIVNQATAAPVPERVNNNPAPAITVPVRVPEAATSPNEAAAAQPTAQPADVDDNLEEWTDDDADWTGVAWADEDDVLPAARVVRTAAPAAPAPAPAAEVNNEGAAAVPGPQPEAVPAARVRDVSPTAVPTQIRVPAKQLVAPEDGSK